MMMLRLQSGVRSHFVTRMPEWGLSATLMAFSIQLLWQPDSFGTSAAYRLLAHFISENDWGYCALAISSSWLAALIINGAIPLSRRWTPLIRSLCALGASFFWGCNAIAYLVALPASPGLINNAGFSFLALASSIIVAREVGAADGIAKRWQTQQITG